MKKTIMVIMLITLSLALWGCSSDNNDERVIKDSGEVQSEKNPQVTIIMENSEEIVLELYPETAPNTVYNFLSLVDDRFYDGLTFHRVIPGFMIQGGDPHGDGTGGPGYSIKGEFESNGIENNIKHDQGVISMARSTDPDSAGSQFFIMHDAAPNLDGDYAAFGKVIEGMDVVDAIAKTDTNTQDKPLEPQIIKRITSDLNDKTYPKPEIIE